MKLNNDVKELNVNEVEVKEVLLEEVTTLEETVTPGVGLICGSGCWGLGCW